ncbi:MAG: fibronectin type III domain-containing protein, partial [Patescibacteria group bacterium]
VNLMPGDGISRWIKVTNNSGDVAGVTIKAVGFTSPIPPEDLARALDIEIKKESNNLYGVKTLAEFYQNGAVSLGNLPDGATAQYDVSVSFPGEKGDEWQGKSTGFNIEINISGEDGGDEGGGTTYTDIGEGTSTGVLRIFNEQIESVSITTNSAVITWMTNKLATSRVVYSDEGQSHIIDLDNAPNYGYANSNTEDLGEVESHTMTLTGLSPNTTYYLRSTSRNLYEFAVSRELTFTTAAVLGESTETGGGGFRNEFVAGAETTTEGEGEVGVFKTEELETSLASVGIFLNQKYLYWIFFIFIILLTLLHLFLKMKDIAQENDKKLILPAIIIALIIIYCRVCCLGCGFFCCPTCWILLIVNIILFAISFFIKKKQNVIAL